MGYDVPTTIGASIEATAAHRLRSLDALPVNTEGSHRVGREDDRIAGAIDCTALREAVAQLSKQDRGVLFEYFIKGRTQPQIAADHHVSQMQVARWITAAIRRLQNLLE